MKSHPFIAGISWRTSLIIIAFYLAPFSGNGQNTNISGVVNSYHAVIDIIPAQACVRVSSTAGLSLYERVLLIQMKGATVNTANNSSYGDTTTLGNAGNYELGTICDIRGDSVFLFHTIMNNYTVSENVQLVGVPVYYSATVTDTLKATPWNSTTGTGGIIAIMVDELLTLNAPISADSAGFKGGLYKLSNGTCSNALPANGYVYNANASSPQNGAHKGESIYAFATNVGGGRGAPANGGGGGNNHNNGGGGGANLSAGGAGGCNFSSTGCTVPVQSQGGKPLSNHGGEKIFFGGGGGAGHSNNIVASRGGGNGGGIIFIHANNIAGNNQKISANGQGGGSGTSDGAAGAGAGGTIILHSATYSGNVNVEANGGVGGTTDNGLNSRRCYGAGGGGSGGAVFFNGPTPAITIATNGGNAGTAFNNDPLCNAPILAGAGSAGVVINNYIYRSSTEAASFCAQMLLPVRLLAFSASYADNKTLLEWKLSDPVAINKVFVQKLENGVWITIAELHVSSSGDYHFVDPSPSVGYNFYRLGINHSNNTVFYSPLRKVYVGPASNEIYVYPNPAKKEIFIKSSNPALETITLLDRNGRLLMEKVLIINTDDTKITLPLLPAGTYILKIGNTIKRIVIAW